MSIRPKTTTVDSLRSDALDALIALHRSDPELLIELAEIIEHAAELHTAIAPVNVACDDCAVKWQVARLLRSVAELRALVDLGLGHPFGDA
jgi:hypothetical protein